MTRSSGLPQANGLLPSLNPTHLEPHTHHPDGKEQTIGQRRKHMTKQNGILPLIKYKPNRPKRLQRPHSAPPRPRRHAKRPPLAEARLRGKLSPTANGYALHQPCRHPPSHSIEQHQPDTNKLTRLPDPSHSICDVVNRTHPKRTQTNLLNFTIDPTSTSTSIKCSPRKATLPTPELLQSRLFRF